MPPWIEALQAIPLPLMEGVQGGMGSGQQCPLFDVPFPQPARGTPGWGLHVQFTSAAQTEQAPEVILVQTKPLGKSKLGWHFEKVQGLPHLRLDMGHPDALGARARRRWSAVVHNAWMWWLLHAEQTTPPYTAEQTTQGLLEGWRWLTTYGSPAKKPIEQAATPQAWQGACAKSPTLAALTAQLEPALHEHPWVVSACPGLALELRQKHLDRALAPPSTKERGPRF